MMTIDIWSIGCIFAEMFSGKPLFTGLNDNDQIKKIFRIMGTPNEKVYPNIKKLSEWNPENFEVYPAQELKTLYPTMEEEGLKLLEAMLRIDPDARISTDEILVHPYFDEIQSTIIKEIYK